MEEGSQPSEPNHSPALEVGAVERIVREELDRNNEYFSDWRLLNETSAPCDFRRGCWSSNRFRPAVGTSRRRIIRHHEKTYSEGYRRGMVLGQSALLFEVRRQR